MTHRQRRRILLAMAWDTSLCGTSCWVNRSGTRSSVAEPLASSSNNTEAETFKPLLCEAISDVSWMAAARGVCTNDHCSANADTNQHTARGTRRAKVHHACRASEPHLYLKSISLDSPAHAEWLSALCT